MMTKSATTAASPQTMTDGLYRVVTKYLCAGFIVSGGQVVECAPILRKKIGYWKTIAKRISRCT